VRKTFYHHHLQREAVQAGTLLGLKLRHPRCVRNNEVRDNVGQNTTGLLAGCSYGVSETACFGLIGGHLQVYKVGSKKLIIMRAADV